MADAGDGYLRIGELSRRVGVSAELLRAWERRYGLLRPTRSSGGFRLYSVEDEQRVRRMQELLARGVSAAEAARLALEGRSAPGTEPALDDLSAARLSQASQRLEESLDAFDEAGAQAALDRLLSAFTIETVLRDVLFPYLHELGRRWERGEASVGQEHFASHLLRGRLLALARGWGRGTGPRAILACAPDELHDLALIGFGLVLRGRGWRITYLGPDTPLDTLVDLAREIQPELVVIASTVSERLGEEIDAIAALAREVPVALAGPGASAAVARAAGTRLLGDDPVTAAERVSALGG